MAITQASQATLAKNRNPSLAKKGSPSAKAKNSEATMGKITWYGGSDYGDAAKKLLRKTKEKDKRRIETFIESFPEPVIVKVIEDSGTFADILNYAIENNFIKQNELSRRIGYANSQVGRWAANKSSPPRLVRKEVLKEVVNMVQETLAGFE